MLVKCPHCRGEVDIEAINCGIFRHGVFKKSNQQIPSHASKQEIDTWILQDAIWGCGQPFRINGENVEVCEFI